jgi:L-alanine-DL-glutamate epimerase-like enolase superfamily enzyme
MNITAIKTGLLNVPLLKPFKTALRTVETLRSVVVAITTDSGTTGWGEAPPTGAITGDSLGGIRGAIHEFIAPRLIGKDIANLEDCLDTLERSCIKNTSAKAAIDMALYDSFGQLHKTPLYQLLGGFRRRIETDLTISVNSPEEMARDSQEAVARGFRILKIKVGTDPDLDIKRLQAVRRAIGDGPVIRVDANQGWSPREAVRIMALLEKADHGIELVEQPVLAHDFDGLKYVRDHIATPVLADEAVFTAHDAEELIRRNAADYLNIKLMKTGGIRGALRICALAEIHGVECFMGCMMESKLSVTAATHVACAKSCITRYDLDSAALCAVDPLHGGVTVAGAALTLTDQPGLGIQGIDGVTWD